MSTAKKKPPISNIDNPASPSYEPPKKKATDKVESPLFKIALCPLRRKRTNWTPNLRRRAWRRLLCPQARRRKRTNWKPNLRLEMDGNGLPDFEGMSDEELGIVSMANINAEAMERLDVEVPPRRHPRPDGR